MDYKNLLLPFLLVFCLNGVAQEVRISLNNTVLEKDVLSKIQNSFSFQINFFGGIFDEKDRINSITARIFDTEKAFARYSKENANYNPIANHTLAFYDPVLKEMILHQEVDDLARVFSHEISHAILDHYCPSASSWLSEGLAEFLEDIILVDSLFYFDIGQVTKINDVKHYLKEGELIRTSISANNFYEKASHANYTLSWAVVAYLFKTNPDVLRRIVRGNCADGNDTFELHYPGGIDLIEMDVKSYFLNSVPYNVKD